jgi:hypothetical protein
VSHFGEAVNGSLKYFNHGAVSARLEAQSAVESRHQFIDFVGKLFSECFGLEFFGNLFLKLPVRSYGIII